MGNWLYNFGRSAFIALSVYCTILVVVIALLAMCNAAQAGPPDKRSPRSKFYDFSEQLIDGEIKKPTTLYLDTREKVRFERLLRLKKSFLPNLFDTARERVFK